MGAYVVSSDKVIGFYYHYILMPIMKVEAKQLG